MHNRATALLAASLVFAASMAYSQDTETSVTDDTTAASETAAGIDDLSMGTAVDDAPAFGTPYIRELSGDWSVRCITAEQGVDDPCQLYQLLFDADGNSVAEFSMFPLPTGGQAAAGATIVVPLETLLTEQITLSVDGASKRRYPISFCNTSGCVARVGFTSDEVNQFKRGNAALMRIVPAGAPDQEVNLTISLSGFTAGYNSLN